MATPTTAGLIVLKQPRTGSTWLKAELNALPGICHVPVYEILSPRWQDHPGNILGHTDCTHYGRVSNELVWKALIAAGEV